MKRVGGILDVRRHTQKKEKWTKLTRGYKDWQWDRFMTIYQAIVYHTGVPTELAHLILCDLLRTYFTREIYLARYNGGGGGEPRRLIAYTCDCSGGFYAFQERIQHHLALSGIRLERLRDYGIAASPGKRWRLHEQSDLLLCLDEVPSETRLIVTFYGDGGNDDDDDDDDDWGDIGGDLHTLGQICLNLQGT